MSEQRASPGSIIVNVPGVAGDVLSRRSRAAIFLVPAAAALVLAGACRRPHTTSEAAQVDALFAEWSKPGSPGCSLGVSRAGTTVYERGYGMASLELGVPITPASVFPAASISKSFTAMSIVLLAERGQLSLDDEVRKQFPEWAEREHRVTIRHLLTHTGGLRDVFLLIELAAPVAHGTNTNDALSRILVRQRGLNFAPGDEYEYNNGGYNLLGHLVKRVTGQPLAAFADENIFKPLGMTHTHFHDDKGLVVPNRVSNYSRDAKGFRLAWDEGGIIGNSGLYTTTGDLLRWTRNFSDPHVGARASLAAMQTSTTLTGGRPVPYGLGLELGQHRGLRTIGHGGGDRGISTYVVHYPDQQFSVAILCNTDAVGPVGLLTQRVAEIYLANVLTPGDEGTPPATPARVTLPPEQLANRAGLYRDVSSGLYGRIFLREGKLMASTNAGTDGNAFELVPVAGGRFVIVGTPIVAAFVPAAGDRPQEIHVSGVGPRPMVSREVARPSASTVDVGSFVGRYTCPDLDVTYSIARRGSGLVLEMPAGASAELELIAPDTFSGSLVDVIEFSRDRRGRVTGFTVHSNGARNLPFERVE